MRKIIRWLARKLSRPSVAVNIGKPSDLSSYDASIIDAISGQTMTTLERQIALINAVRYLARHNLPGVFVECGVWRGGSAMAIALTLLQEGVNDREIYLFDTFEGMTDPESIDKMWSGESAAKKLQDDPEKKGLEWAVASLGDVQENMRRTGYPTSLIHYIEGPVESTIPGRFSPQQIALLRLDTDWYASTKHELVHLYPRLIKSGVLIIDDYGWWQGARRAVDEYFHQLRQPIYLHRVDESGRCLIK